MLKEMKKRCKTKEDALRLQDYLLRDEVYINSDERFDEKREELTVQKYNELYGNEINELENLLQNTNDDFDVVEYNNYINSVNLPDYKNRNNKWLIKDDIHSTLRVAHNMDDFKREMILRGHTLEIIDNQLLYDGIPPTDLNYKSMRYGYEDIENQIAYRNAKRHNTAPHPEKMIFDNSYLQIKELKNLAYNCNEYYDKFSGKVYRYNPNWKQCKSRYGKTYWKRRGFLEQLYIKICCRDKQIETVAQRYADIKTANQREKFDKAKEIEEKRLSSCHNIFCKYGVYSQDTANLVIKKINYDIQVELDKKSLLQKELYTVNKKFSQSSSINIALINKKNEILNKLSYVKSNIAILNTDIKSINNDVIPYLNESYSNRVKAYKLKSKSDKLIAKEHKELKKQIEQYESLLNLKQQHITNYTNTKDIRDRLDQLKKESAKYVKVTKCDNKLILTNHIDNPHTAVDEFINNNIKNGYAAPDGKSRFVQQIVISLHPKDIEKYNITPSDLKKLVEEFYKKSKSYEDYQSFAVIHTDHFTGYDKNTDTYYNKELEDKLGKDKQTLHAQILQNCTSTQHIRFRDDGTPYINSIRKWQDGLSAKKHGYDTLQDLNNSLNQLLKVRGWDYSYLSIKEIQNIDKDYGITKDITNISSTVDITKSPEILNAELKTFYKQNINNKEVIKDKVRKDIDYVITTKKPRNMDEFKKEMKKLGYEIRDKQGYLYFSPDIKAKASEIPQISSKDLDKINGQKQFTYERSNINGRFSGNLKEEIERIRNTVQGDGQTNGADNQNRQLADLITAERRRTTKERERIVRVDNATGTSSRSIGETINEEHGIDRPEPKLDQSIEREPNNNNRTAERDNSPKQERDNDSGFDRD